MLSTIDIPKFIEWALTQSGYSIYEGKLTFYRFYFAKLDKSIQNKQIRLYKQANGLS